MSEVCAKKKDEDEQERSKAEFKLVFEAFQRFLLEAEDSAESWEVFEDIVSLRASFLIDRVITGLRLDFDQAYTLLRESNTNLTQSDKQKRDILVAAIDNLIDFAAAEEYLVLSDIEEYVEGSEEEIDMESDEEVFSIIEKYNLQYAFQENLDVSYATKIALMWAAVSEGSLVTFMTQGDDRVRDSHLALEGLTYTKSSFPAELIPPIDWACRCYLLSSGGEFDAIGSSKSADIKKVINPIFKESLAKGGRIFSDNHPYFKIPKSKVKALKKITKNIKSKFFIK